MYFRAYCHSRQQHYDLAKVDYETFIQLDPSYLDARLALDDLVRQGTPRAALKEWYDRCR